MGEPPVLTDAPFEIVTTIGSRTARSQWPSPRWTFRQLGLIALVATTANLMSGLAADGWLQHTSDLAQHPVQCFACTIRTRLARLGFYFDRRGRPHLQFPAPSWLAALEDASFLGIRRSCLHLYARHSRQPESIPAADSATRWRKAPRRGMPADRGGRTVLGMAIARSPGSWESCALSAKAPLRHRPTGCKQPFNLVTSRLS